MVVFALTLAGLVGPSAARAVTLTHAPSDLATAIASDPSTLASSSFVLVPGAATPSTGVAPTYGPAAPRDGESVAVMSNGSVALPSEPGAPSDRNGFDQGSAARSAFDVTTLRLDLAVPAGVNCLALQYDFFTQDFANPTDTYFDSFVAELDPTAPWDAPPGPTIAAPANFAVDSTGNPVSFKSAGAGSIGYNGAPVATNASGTGYAGALGWATAMTPVDAGAHRVDLSIFDRGDHLVDSAVVLDNLRLIDRRVGACVRGVVADADLEAPSVSLDAPANGSASAAAAPRFSGTGGHAAGDENTVQVKLYPGSSATGEPVQVVTATVTAGAWQATASALSPGTYTAQAEQADAQGNVGLSHPTTVVVLPASNVPTADEIRRQLTSDVAMVATAARQGSIFSLIRRGGFTANKIAAPAAGRLTISLTAASPAHSATPAAKPSTIATGTLRIASAGRYSIRVTLTHKGRRVLRNARRFTGTLSVSFTPTVGPTQLRSARITLTR
jgi:hypothetical protein